MSTNAAVVGSARTPNEHGYWLAFADGTIVAFGNARSYGSLAGQTLRAPIAAMTATTTGRGYRLVDAKGGVFAFGDARSYGSARDVLAF